MSRGKLEQERRRRRRDALHLLTVSGAVRPADVEVCYRGTDRLLGTWLPETDLSCSEALVNHRSIWDTDLRELWDTVSSRISATIRRAERSSRVAVALAKILPVTH